MSAYPVGSPEWLAALDHPEAEREQVSWYRRRARQMKATEVVTKTGTVDNRPLRGPRGGQYNYAVSRISGQLYRRYF